MPNATDLMKGIVVNAKNGEKVTKSQNSLVALLERLPSKSDTAEKKKILSTEYGMKMTEEFRSEAARPCVVYSKISQKHYCKKTHHQKANQGKRLQRKSSYGSTEKEYEAVEKFTLLHKKSPLNL